MDFITEVVGWYNKNKRDLPWRNSSDPYIIWLSEIILQQTRVEQGLPYFHRFTEAYPTIADFASASEDDILRMWQGLGYYSRGRNMHKTAQIVMEEHEGYFPKSYNQLIKLKGIGEYTAAAISSFANDEAKAVVDGNVFRLLSRYFAIKEPINSTKGKKTFTVLANELIDRNAPGTSNQAVMEFGSIICKPRNPACNECPLALNCQARRSGNVHDFPVKVRAAKSRNRYFNYVVAIEDNEVVLSKRVGKDIWQGLHEFPLFEAATSYTSRELLDTNDFRSVFGEDVVVREEHGPLKHILSHQNIFAKFFVIENFSVKHYPGREWIKVHLNDLQEYAQPKLIFAFTEKFF